MKLNKFSQSLSPVRGPGASQPSPLAPPNGTKIKQSNLIELIGPVKEFQSNLIGFYPYVTSNANRNFIELLLPKIEKLIETSDVDSKRMTADGYIGNITIEFAKQIASFMSVIDDVSKNYGSPDNKLNSVIQSFIKNIDNISAKYSAMKNKSSRDEKGIQELSGLLNTASAQLDNFKARFSDIKDKVSNLLDIDNELNKGVIVNDNKPLTYESWDKKTEQIGKSPSTWNVDIRFDDNVYSVPYNALTNKKIFGSWVKTELLKDERDPTDNELLMVARQIQDQTTRYNPTKV